MEGIEWSRVDRHSSYTHKVLSTRNIHIYIAMTNSLAIYASQNKIRKKKEMEKLINSKKQ